MTVGPVSRARILAAHLSQHPSPPVVVESERGFLTITGWYHYDDAVSATGTDQAALPLDHNPNPNREGESRRQRVRISIMSIGMGAPNMDFFVREGRVCVLPSEEDMVIVRLGSCGGIDRDDDDGREQLGIGTLAVPAACVAVTRNLDYPFGDTLWATFPSLIVC